MKRRPPIDDRPTRVLSQDIVDSILGIIRSSFYQELPDKSWYSQRGFLLRVVTWPAAWLDRRGVSLPPDRFREILFGIIMDVKMHGATDRITYCPGYLLHCVQEHFRCHGETYYEEGKSLRATAERALSSARKSGARAVDSVQVLSQVNAVLLRRPRMPGAKHAQPPAKTVPGQQLDLL